MTKCNSKSFDLHYLLSHVCVWLTRNVRSVMNHRPVSIHVTTRFISTWGEGWPSYIFFCASHAHIF